jgi:magnesium transporter
MAKQGPEGPRGWGRKVVVFSYDESAADREEVDDLSKAFNRIGRRKVTWIVVKGRLEGRDLAIMRERLGLHPVMIEELAEDLPGRPRLIDYHEIIFVSWKLLALNGPVVEERKGISLLGKGFLLTVVPAGRDYQKTFEDLQSEHNELRGMGADYLLYELIDTVIDEYFTISEELGNLIEEAQDRILEGVGRAALIDVQQLRRALIKVRKAIWPLREAVNSLVKGHSDLVDDYTAPYFRDAYDHTIELMDTIDTHRDMLSEMLDMYQSEVSNQLNQVVKLLTLISVIFAPLTFIVGLYGMNFRYMPELGSSLGYPVVLLVMLVIAVAMVMLFRRKGWF